jgi:adenine-specific DNA-methyltransferase
MKPERVHIFESRKDTFHKDSVLQENIILKARKSNNSKNIEISFSTGINDIEKSPIHLAPLNHVLFQRNGDILFRLPVDEQDDSILIKVDEWTGSLHKFGMEISTGPVVPFRTTEFLLSSNIENSDHIAPLLWMTNVYAMKVLWPKNGKLLIKDSNYVLLHRFSAKEQHRRLTAAPFLKGKLKSEKIGIENHLNYIYRLDGTLTDTETLGLAAIFNSSILDRYFRISNGNTQVSATEIRAMPLPPLNDITEIGERLLKLSHTPTLEELDKMVWSKL